MAAAMSFPGPGGFGGGWLNGILIVLGIAVVAYKIDPTVLWLLVVMAVIVLLRAA